MKRRNVYPDLLKAFCLFLTVTIHAPFPGAFGIYANAVSRTAVPVFLLLSGFFYDESVKRKGRAPQIVKVFLLLSFALAVHFLFELWLYAERGELAKLLPSLLEKEKLLRFFLLNEPPYGVHVWYLSAFLYVLILFALFRGRTARKIFYLAAPVLLVVQAALTVTWNGIPSPYARNFLLTALPYFSLGAFLSERKENLLPILAKRRILIPALLFFIGTAALEITLYRLGGAEPVKEYYASTPFQAFAAVLLVLRERRPPATFFKRLSRLGSVYLTPVYILHPIFIELAARLAESLRLSVFYEPVKPIVVFVFTTAFVALCFLLKKGVDKIKIKEKDL